jgi:hypothetical protein
MDIFLENPLIFELNLQRMKFLKNHPYVLNTFHIPKNQDQFELPYLYGISKLQKKSYKQK